MEQESLLEKINEKFAEFSKGQRKLAEFIMAEYDKAAFMTAAKIGEVVGVSESTVVRFASMLGYQGFPEMQKALADVVQKRIHEAPQINIDNENISRREVLELVLQKDMENMRDTLEQIDRNSFDVAVDIMLNARKVYIVGLRNSAPLAMYMGGYLNLMLEQVVVITADNGTDMFEQMLTMNEEDCVVGISFPRYSMRTLKALEFANSRNVSVITLTDNVNSPMNLYSSCNLVAKSEMTSVAESFTAPMSIINAMITYLIARRKKNYINRLEMLEDICNEYAVTGNDEMNMVDDSELIRSELGRI